jgi:uncharacterized repeat protein (TIGR04138 family)
MKGKPDKSMEEVILEDGRYPLEAFGFLHDGLTKAVREIHGDEPPAEGQRHVTGKQLCEGLRDLAIERWGMLARVVLNKWNIRETIDFGNMVYLLVENNFMRKTDEDSLEDFRDVFEFDKAFSGYRAFELKE